MSLAQQYDPFSPPPADYVSAWIGWGTPQVLAKHSTQDHPTTHSVNRVRDDWPSYDWWLPMPAAPVKTKRYKVYPAFREDKNFEVCYEPDKKNNIQVAWAIPTQEAAEQIAAIYERQGAELAVVK